MLFVSVSVSPARAFELFDGRVQIHGFYEMQLRTINADFSEQWDVTQWYNVFNLELELDLVQDTIGPLDLLQAYIRLEVRYDCVYSQGCGMFPSINTYGDKAKNLPRRLSNATRYVTAGAIPLYDDEDFGTRYSDNFGRRVVNIENAAFIDALAEVSTGGDGYLGKPDENSECLEELGLNLCRYFATGEFAPRREGELTTTPIRTPLDMIVDDPLRFISADFIDYGFTNVQKRNNQVAIMGPWRPQDKIYALATMARFSNPFDSSVTSKDEPLLFSVAFNGRLLYLYEDLDQRPGRQDNLTDDQWYKKISDSIDNAPGWPDDGEPSYDPWNNPGLYNPAFVSSDPTGGVPARLTWDNCDNINFCPEKLEGSVGQGSQPIDFTIEPANQSYVPFNNRAYQAWHQPVPLQLNPDGSIFIDPDTNQPVQNNASWLFADWEGNDPTQNPRGYTGKAGNWATMFIEHNEDPFGINRVFTTRQKGDFVDPNKIWTTERLWTPYRSMRDFEKGAMEFAEAATFGGALPMRPVSVQEAGGELGDVPLDPKGAYYPSTGLREVLKSGRLNKLPFNINESRRSFNRGYAQRTWKELKEAYLDVELFDSRLWLRIGRQTIVWGKTELFSISDQFNPQDFALASLPSLEESRLPLWAVRGVYSLYSIGPVDDIRLEVAFNFDKVQPADLGACGEAYTVNAVCELTFGLYAHGAAGLGVIGIDRPPSPWESARGFEIGGRIEWRWDRFSFALANFYGYSDFPHLQRISTFGRNVDPDTGMGRYYAATDPCSQLFWKPGDPDGRIYPGGVRLGQDSTGCITPGPTTRDDLDNTVRDRPTSNALYNSPANLQLFATACWGTLGVAAAFDPGACGLNFFNTVTDRGRVWSFASLIAGAMAGQTRAVRTFRVRPNRRPAMVRLSNDVSPRGAAAFQGDAFSEPNNPNGISWLGSWDMSNRAWTASDAMGEVDGLSDPTAAALGNDSNCYDDRWFNARSNNSVYRSNTAQNVFNPFRPVGQGTINTNSLFPKANSSTNFATRGELYRPNCGEDSRNFWTYSGAFGSGSNVALNEEFMLSARLSPEQEALIGCGPFWGSNCDVSGMDLLNADASALLQSWIGIDGTETVDLWRTDDASLPQPGTVNFRTWVNDEHPLEEGLNEFGGPKQILGAPRCTTGYLPDNDAQPGDERFVLPGCRGLLRPGKDAELANDVINSLVFLNIQQLGGTGYDAETGYYHDPMFFLFYPYREDGIYEQAYCRPTDGRCAILSNPNSAYQSLLGGDQKEQHNQWELGYDVRVDGNPLGVAPIYDQTQRNGSLGYPDFYCRFEQNRILVENDPNFSCARRTEEQGDTENPADVDWWVEPITDTLNGIPQPQYAKFLQMTDLDPRFANDGQIFAGRGSPTNPAGENGVGNQATLQNGRLGRHPFTGQVWQNELAALSWNLLMFLVSADDDFEREDAMIPGRCGYITPIQCDAVQGLLGLGGLQNRDVRAGGNGTYGRRSSPWLGGGEVVLAYDKRNVLGFAVDFAEDRTKTNWSFDFTWVDDVPVFDAFQRDNLSRVDSYNLTISVDRPTFINFLNPNHTIFFNSQWFVQYLGGWQYGVSNNGPWNVLGTITALTGYFQDRLTAQATGVYDFKSNSGGVLPQVGYRFNQDFSVTFGAAIWFGREQLVESFLNPIGPSVPSTNRDASSQSITNIRDRDELFLRLRYTF